MNKKLKDRFFIATMCGNWQSIAREFNVSIELDQYCQAENMDGERGEKVLAMVKKHLTEYEAAVLHAPFNELFPAAIDPKAKAFAIDRFNQAAAIAIDLGVKKMVVHSGFVPHVYFKEWQVPRSVEFWTEFMSDKPDDFVISIENVLDDEPYMLADIAREINDPRVGVCYDIGHANIVSKLSPEEWLDALAPYINHLHIHNNDGTRDQHKGFIDGVLDIKSILDCVINKCSPDTTLTAELIAGPESFYWLREHDYL